MYTGIKRVENKNRAALISHDAHTNLMNLLSASCMWFRSKRASACWRCRGPNKSCNMTWCWRSTLFSLSIHELSIKSLAWIHSEWPLPEIFWPRSVGVKDSTLLLCSGAASKALKSPQVFGTKKFNCHFFFF